MAASGSGLFSSSSSSSSSASSNVHENKQQKFTLVCQKIENDPNYRALTYDEMYALSGDIVTIQRSDIKAVDAAGNSVGATYLITQKDCYHAEEVFGAYDEDGNEITGPSDGGAISEYILWINNDGQPLLYTSNDGKVNFSRPIHHTKDVNQFLTKDSWFSKEDKLDAWKTLMRYKVDKKIPVSVKEDKNSKNVASTPKM